MQKVELETPRRRGNKQQKSGGNDNSWRRVKHIPDEPGQLVTTEAGPGLKA